MPSVEFETICRDLKEFGQILHLTADKNGLSFEVQGGVDSGSVLLKPRESEKPEEKVSLQIHEPVTASFALRYLVYFCKAAPLCGDTSTVTLGLLETEEKGHMKFYLAPKQDE